jgi:hypothetical protein
MLFALDSVINALSTPRSEFPQSESDDEPKANNPELQSRPNSPTRRQMSDKLFNANFQHNRNNNKRD